MKKYTVQLDAQQRQMLESMLTGGKEAACSQTHARILLKADQGSIGPGWTDEQIAEVLTVGRTTVERVRKRFIEGGLLDALVRRPSWNGQRLEKWMENWKRTWSHWPVVRQKEDESAGPCDCWQTHWCNWAMWIPSVTKRCG